jgi:plasmid stabilization system protein ParE
MKAVLSEIARDELAEAVAYYRSQNFALGESFIQEFISAVARVEEFPRAWQPLSKNTRRCRLHRFPFGLIYQERRDDVLIIAVAHLHREPNHWKDRA